MYILNIWFRVIYLYSAKNTNLRSFPLHLHHNLLAIFQLILESRQFIIKFPSQVAYLLEKIV